MGIRRDQLADHDVTYAFGSVIGGHGIGRIAGRAVEGVHRAGLLDQVIAWEREGLNVPTERVRSPPLGKYLDTVLRYYYNDATFDWYTNRVLDSPALFHGWNNMCLRAMQTAADRGAITVVERASTHPAVQRRLVEAEYEQFGIDEGFIHDRLYDRAIAELNLADAIFVPSSFVYDSFVEEDFDESRLVEIPFGVDTEQFRPPDDPGRPDGEFTALFVGALSLRKGIQYLLPGWQRADVDGELRLAGKVAENAEPIVEEYRDDPTIHFLDWVDDPAEEYRNASVFVFPTIEEGSALVTYEAMAAGLPSIVTPNAGSLIEDDEHGAVVKPRDARAVADAIEALGDDPERRRAMGRAARRTVEDYTWEQYGDRVAQAHADLL